MSESNTGAAPSSMVPDPRGSAASDRLRMPDIESSEDNGEDSADEGETQPIKCPSFIICTEIIPPARPYPSFEANSGVLYLAVQTSKMWTVGSTIKISFERPGNDVLFRKKFDYGEAVNWVKTYASIWLRYANLSFKFIDGPFEEGQIRITFRPGLGHYSYVGRVTSAVDRSEPTMNFDPDEINTTIDLRRFRAIVLHEFGHALGCIHEHSQPNAAIDWNEPFVLNFYKTRHGWDEDKVRRNVLKKYELHSAEDGLIEATEFDTLSIMQYDIGSDFTKDGKSYNPGERLSPNDKRLIAQCYPSEPCNTGTFTIRAKEPKQPDTSMVASLPSDTIAEMRRSSRLCQVVLGVTRVATDRDSNLKSGFSVSYPLDTSKPEVLLHAFPNSNDVTTYQGSWLTLAASGLDVQYGHLTILVKSNEVRKRVLTFPNPYPPGDVPHVVVWLHSVESTLKDRIELGHSIDVAPNNINNTSFQLGYVGSQTCTLGVSWLSYSSTRLDMHSGSCYYEAPDGANEAPQGLLNSHNVAFIGKPSSKPVKVFVAFSGVTTTGGDASVSVDVPKDTITPKGMTLNIRSSEETSLTIATVTYLAIDSK